MLKGIDSIEGLTPEQIEQINSLVSPLVAKKEELLDKANKYKQQINEEESAAEKLRLLEAKIEREKLEEKQNYQDAIGLQEQEYKSHIEKLAKEKDEKDALIHKLLVDNGLSAELSALNVNKDLMPIIQQGFAAQAVVTDGQAMIGDKTLSEYCKEWSETPAGKAACIAPHNSGANSNGSMHNGDSSKKWNDYSAGELSQIHRTNPDEYERLKQTR